MQYTVLSPWASTGCAEPRGLSPRLDTLKGKTIGLYAHFKDQTPEIMRALGQVISDRYPDTKLKYIQYTRDTAELPNDPDGDAMIRSWLSDVDGVITGLGDAGSCAMYLMYNTAYLEKLGVPCVGLTQPAFRNSARRGASARGVPGLRIVEIKADGASQPAGTGMDAVQGGVATAMRTEFEEKLDEILGGLLEPLTPEEATPARRENYAEMTFTGTLRELDKLFYRHGWTNGTPIVPPTREAVDEMLRGTDLPADFVVGELPPMLGQATVEKIAINGVMAGCLPIHMPVLIAAVEAMLDPKIHLEGWTCSVASWMPLSIVTGPAAKQMGIYSGAGYLSPYHKANSAIPRAIAYLVMNISGVRLQTEDMSGIGNMNRFGVTIGEDQEASPWEPLHCRYGLRPEDSALTLFWPSEPQILNGRSARDILREMCAVKAHGWDCGSIFILNPDIAGELSRMGYDREKLMDYVMEYNRVPSEQNTRFNNHEPKGSLFAEGPGYSSRLFWNTDHMIVAVNGRSFNLAITGGGDHGGPACVKLRLPEKWEALVEEYSDYMPDYIDY